MRILLHQRFCAGNIWIPADWGATALVQRTIYSQSKDRESERASPIFITVLRLATLHETIPGELLDILGFAVLTFEAGEFPLLPVE